VGDDKEFEDRLLIAIDFAVRHNGARETLET
jgi:hypothetical protein